VPQLPAASVMVALLPRAAPRQTASSALLELLQQRKQTTVVTAASVSFPAALALSWEVVWAQVLLKDAQNILGEVRSSVGAPVLDWWRGCSGVSALVLSRPFQAAARSAALQLRPASAPAPQKPSHQLSLRVHLVPPPQSSKLHPPLLPSTWLRLMIQRLVCEPLQHLVLTPPQNPRRAVQRRTSGCRRVDTRRTTFRVVSWEEGLGATRKRA